jgi:amidase
MNGQKVPGRGGEGTARVALAQKNGPVTEEDEVGADDAAAAVIARLADLNPHDPRRTIGGSSGGPAAAVAADLTPADLGSDLAGSLRLPAHYCGAYGLRPTHGLIPARGHIPRPPGWITSSDMVTPGPLACHPRDLDLLLAALTTPSPDENNPWSVKLPTARRPIGQLRVAVWADDASCPVDRNTADALATVERTLASAGATVRRTAGPVGFADSLRLFEQLLHANATAASDDEAGAAELAAARDLHTDDASPRAAFLRHRTQTHRAWLRANEERLRFRQTWHQFFADAQSTSSLRPPLQPRRSRPGAALSWSTASNGASSTRPAGPT